jgi:dipeptidyl aminopeptidase/acylaminoacyl peptidase
MAKNTRLTVERLWKLARPAQPTLSPDGAQACISVSTFDMKANKATSRLWLLSTFGGAPRQLTTVGEKDGEPQWSPDGTRIAFVARREGDDEPQVYLIAPDGGEAERLTSFPTGATSIKWFPDGKALAFVSWVWPGTRGEKALAKRYKEHKDDKVKAHVVEHALYRFWDHWLSDGRVPHLFTVDAKTGKVRDLFEGTALELPRADTSSTHYDISPDGREVAFVFDPEEEKRLDHEHHIVALDLKSGRHRTLTATSPRDHDSPRYSPDGRTIALLVTNLRRSVIAPHELALLDRRSGRLEVVSQRWDRSLHAPLCWSADSQSVFFTAEDDARLNLFRFALGSKAPELVALGGTIPEFAISGEVAVFIRNDMSTPPAVIASRGGHETRLDGFNDEVMAEVRLGKVEERRFKGWNGDEVQMWVIYPPDFDAKKKWPLLHNIHGGPHSAWADNFHFRWNNHAFAAQGYVVVCVNYHGSTGFGRKFTESIHCDLGRRELVDVEAGTDHMLKRGFIDAKRLIAAGGSYGGYMVAWMNGHTDRYRAYVCHAGCFDWVAMFADDTYYWHPKELGAFYWDDFAKLESQNPRARVKAMKTPTLVMHGALDYRVPDGQGLAYFNSLKAKGVPARLVFFPDENHWILKPQNSRLWYREFFAWLERHAGPGGGKKALRRK